MYGVPSTPPENMAVIKTEQKRAMKRERESVANSDGDIYGVKSPTDNLTGVETELMGIDGKKQLSIKNGGVCELSVKYSPDEEYVYYVFKGGEFIPVFEDKKWDGRGIKVDAKIVAESYAPIEKFIEVEKGKYLPSEMFSKCEEF
jgi:hypothetical protein